MEYNDPYLRVLLKLFNMQTDGKVPLTYKSLDIQAGTFTLLVIPFDTEEIPRYNNYVDDI